MDDMHLLVDEQTADRLVSGDVAPDDAHPGYARLASLVRAAQAPGSRDELVGEGAVASMAAAVVSNALVPPGGRWRPLATGSGRNRVVPCVLTAKAAAVAMVAALGLGTAAAAAALGALPMQGPGDTAQGNTAALSVSNPSTPDAGIPSGSSGSGSNDTNPSAPAAVTAGGTSAIDAPTTGPGNRSALSGLCTAFLAGPGTSTGTGTTTGTGVAAAGRYGSTAFRALIGEAGGTVASATAACTAYLQGAKPPATPGAPHGNAPTGGSSGAHPARPAPQGHRGAARGAKHGPR